ncbi:MAG: hypothetical protein LBU89_05010 [Fibromonadaceae bacterium]|nr:hypothetical protein [Fibromonadaceae bacterium]
MTDDLHENLSPRPYNLYLSPADKFAKSGKPGLGLKAAGGAEGKRNGKRSTANCRVVQELLVDTSESTAALGKVNRRRGDQIGSRALLIVIISFQILQVPNLIIKVEKFMGCIWHLVALPNGAALTGQREDGSCIPEGERSAWV